MKIVVNNINSDKEALEQRLIHSIVRKVQKQKRKKYAIRTISDADRSNIHGRLSIDKN